MQHLTKLEQIRQLTSATRFKRFTTGPLKYLYGHLIKYISASNKKGYRRRAPVFFGGTMEITLPSGLDIYLFGAKTHDSEIRLAKFLIGHLNSNSVFFDVGAHYGYYTLLAHALSCKKIVSFEASENSYRILINNIDKIDSVVAINAAVCEKARVVTFYEFPPLYAENNTIHLELFRNEAWLKDNPPIQKSIKGISLDDMIREQGFIPTFVKIDVEGAELDVLRGLSETLVKYPMTISVEFILSDDKFLAYKQVNNYLKSIGYTAHLIDNDGKLEIVNDIVEFKSKAKVESENLIYSKK